MVQLMRRRKTDEAGGDSPEVTARIEDPPHRGDPHPLGRPARDRLCSRRGPPRAGHVDLESETLESDREQGVDLIVPLIGQGELLGALYLGPRLSDQPYSTDDRRLLAASPPRWLRR